MNDLTSILLLGFGATAATDLWGLARRPLFGAAPPDYAPVGRWIGHMRHGRFRHPSIAKSAPVAGERLIGWSFHYATGVAFAGLLIALAGRAWLQQPTLPAALAVGIGTVAAPWLLMQPAMGAGLAAHRAPHPARARLQSLLLHAAFGFGLYFSGLALRWLASR